MRHTNTLWMVNSKKIIIALVSIACITLFIKFIPSIKGVQAFAGIGMGDESGEFYKFMLSRTIPVLQAGTDEEEGPTSIFGYVLSKYISKIDLQNPKTYLTSEIPLLGLASITTFSGSVEGKTGGSTDTGQGSQPEDRGSNFDSQPVTNPNIDYSKPAVLIYYTHTGESFIPTARYNYEMIGDHRIWNNNYNICRVGLEIKNYMETYYGVAVIQDTTIHDRPYTGSYSRSRPTAEKLLKQYPDAAFILDIHRDAFPDDKAGRKKMVVNINGDQAARIMFVVSKRNPHYQENYALASKLNQKMQELYPGLSRGIDIKTASLYNQDISNRALLIEIGSECNTMEEELVSAKMMARVLGQFIEQ